MRHSITLAVVLFFSVTLARADEYRSKISEGCDYYKNGEYDKATDQFKQAGILRPEQALPSYDKGTALYKSNDFENAADEFGSAVSKNDERLAADAYYNAGNSFFRSQKYDRAIKAYVDALKLNSKDKDYKHNLEMAYRQMQMQQQNKENKQNQDKNKQNQDQKNQQQPKQQDQRKNQEQNQAQQDKKQQEQQKQQQASAQKQEMTPQQAQSLLARFAEDEKDIQKRLKQVHVRGRSLNDW
jgi:tetratricopeptide (TPR) repeat protein